MKKKLYVLKNIKTGKYCNNTGECRVTDLSDAQLFDEEYIKEYKELVKSQGLFFKNEKFVEIKIEEKK